MKRRLLALSVAAMVAATMTFTSPAFALVISDGATLEGDTNLCWLAGTCTGSTDTNTDSGSIDSTNLCLPGPCPGSDDTNTGSGDTNTDSGSIDTSGSGTPIDSGGTDSGSSGTDSGKKGGKGGKKPAHTKPIK